MKKAMGAIYCGIGFFAGGCCSQLREENSLLYSIGDAFFGLTAGATLFGLTLAHYYLTRTPEQKQIAESNRSLERYFANRGGDKSSAQISILHSLRQLHNELVQMEVPADFKCPITMETMSDPVTLEDGKNYERLAIYDWYVHGNRTCPVIPSIKISGDPIKLPANEELQKEIKGFLEDQLEKIDASKNTSSVSPV